MNELANDLQPDSTDPDEEVDDLGFDWLTEEWIPAGEALKLATDLYASVSLDRQRAERDAISALQYRLEHGYLWARAPRWSHSIRYSGVEAGLEKYFEGSYINQCDADLIGTSFWQNLRESQRWEANPPESDWTINFTRTDWIAGDLEFHCWTTIEKGPMRGMEIDGYAIGLCFNRSGLPTTQCILVGNWINAPTSSHNRRVGRPKGAGGWASLDAPLVEKMRILISENPGMTPHRAAGAFVSQAAGNAGFERKQRRLAECYRKAFPGASQ